jgi:probable rRNA maturation factor
VVFTDDTEMRRMNRKHRGKDKTTDVLSFPLDDTTPLLQTRLLGDLVISVPTAQKQAKEYGVPLREELLRLLIHGFLHLLGYDHENVSRKKARAMEQKEEEFFGALVPLLTVPVRRTVPRRLTAPQQKRGLRRAG